MELFMMAFCFTAACHVAYLLGKNNGEKSFLKHGRELHVAYMTVIAREFDLSLDDLNRRINDKVTREIERRIHG